MKNKKLLLIVLVILLSLSLLVGASYAYYMVTASQTNKNRLASSCISVSLTNEKNDITLNNAYPITDSEGKKLTPYQFTITNTCDIFISYNVNLEMLEGTDLSSDYIKTMINSEAPYILSSLDSASTTIDKSTESRTLAQGSLGSRDSVDYALRLWMDENTPLNNDTQDKSLISKIVVVAQPSTYKPSDYVSTLHDAILVNEYGVKNLDNAINKISNKTSPDFSKTAPIIKWIEKKGESATNQVVKPSKNSINIDDLTSLFNSDEYLMRICTKIDFNSSNSTYVLSDCELKDPTTLDYSSNQKYYYFSEYVMYNDAVNKLEVIYKYSYRNISQITSATKNNTKTIWNNKEYDTITYNLNVIPTYAEELETDNSDKGLYQAQDDYGTSYYYRGNISNNYVNFGGYYWQIVRINGDNSIRLIYAGSIKNATGLDASINGKTYSFNESNTSPAYSGYMYGNPDATSYNVMHSNTNSSYIKQNVDNWYLLNIKEKNLDKYISADTGFCGDRTLYAGDGISKNKDTTYATFGRYYSNVPILTCPNKDNDLYTVKTASIGNRSLEYPIGLISYDELVYSGVKIGIKNTHAWSSSNNLSYWMLSPANYYSPASRAGVWIMFDSGVIDGGIDVVVSAGVRPVINLKSDVEISGGIGTINDPYIVKTN